MQRVDRDSELLRLGYARQMQTIGTHFLNVLRPSIDENYVLAILDHEGTNLRTDRTGPHDCDFQTHLFLQS